MDMIGTVAVIRSNGNVEIRGKGDIELMKSIVTAEIQRNKDKRDGERILRYRAHKKRLDELKADSNAKETFKDKLIFFAACCMCWREILTLVERISDEEYEEIKRRKRK